MALSVRQRESRPQAADMPSPFRELEELQARTLQLLENAWGMDGSSDGQTWVPLVDVEETDDAWIIEAEVPGARRGDITIEAHDNELRVSGEIKERERKGILRRRTRRVGQFEYRVTLASPIDPDSIEAKLDGGVLTLRVPKPQNLRPRRVEIRSGDA
jgi:HSP20 family protein